MDLYEKGEQPHIFSKIPNASNDLYLGVRKLNELVMCCPVNKDIYLYIDKFM